MRNVSEFRAVSAPAGPQVTPRPARPRTQTLSAPEVEPPYHVILHNDDEHTVPYVVEMLWAIFGHEPPVGVKMAQEVHLHGRVIVATCHKELAELRVDQIETYGADPRVEECAQSMHASMEPAE